MSSFPTASPWLRRLLLALLCAMLPAWAAASDWPNKPVHVVITYPPGGGADLMGRLIAKKLSDLTGQPFVVENRAGASGQIGASAVAKAPADGYTLLFDASAYATNPALYARLPYDPEKAFIPMAVVAMFPNVLVVTPGFPAKTLQELIALAREKPDTLSYASSGNGATQHLAGALFVEQMKLKMTHIPYRGGGPAMVDVMGGQVPMIFANVASSLGHIRGGKLRPLASTGAQRIPQLPDIPTISETVLPGYEVYEWNALFAPVGTPKDVLEKLSGVLKQALASDEVRNTVAGQGGSIGPDDMAGAAQFVRDQTAFWARVIKSNGIRVE